MGGEITIVEKELSENGTCFRFNTFFILCGSDRGTELREDDHDFASGGGLAYNSFIHNQDQVLMCIAPKQKDHMLCSSFLLKREVKSQRCS